MIDLIGKYLNGYKIVKVEKDPFILGQINLFTDTWETEYFNDKKLVKFFVREEPNTAKIYQEVIDKEKYELQQKINEIIKIIDMNQMKYGYEIKQEIERILTNG